MTKIKNSLYNNYWDVNKSYGWAMSQKLPVGGFKYAENTFKFSKDFAETYYKDSDDGYFFKDERHNDLSFCLKELKLKKLKIW